jgi:uncharacterized protein YbjT (DUF2867 family)
VILVIGPTGCIGRAVVDRLVQSGHPVKLLWHWGHEHLVPRKVMITGGDVRHIGSLRDAMREDGVHTVINLASIRSETHEDRFNEVHVDGTRNVIEAMRAEKINRLITIGSLGAESRSPYPLLKSLGKAEELVRASGLNFTVLKSAVVYGEGDWLTRWITGLARSPLAMPIPHGGETKLQPVWVGDVAACVERCVNLRQTYRQIVPVGGPQALKLSDICAITLKAAGTQRNMIRVPSSLTRPLHKFIRNLHGALDEAMLESLSYNRTTETSGVHRVFGFTPSRMPTRLAHLSPNYETPPLPVQFRPQPRWDLRGRLRD